MDEIESKKQLTLRKPNPEIGFKITAGELTFLGRKIYNCLVYHAQRTGVEGKGKLPHPLRYDLGALISYDKYWWIPMSEINADSGAGSRNHGKVRKYLRALMGVVVERNVVGWEAEHIISKARIIGTFDIDGKKIGDRLLIGWAFPEDLEEKILHPDQYTRLCLYYQSLLRTESALVLYEICKRYSTSPGRVTAKMDWQEWQARLSTDSVRPEYKDFKRDFIKPSIKEINLLTDISIEIIEQRANTRGRPVESFQFSIKIKDQADLELVSSPGVPIELLGQLESIGISPVQAGRFLTQYSEEKIKAAIVLTVARLSNPSLTALAIPAAYFKKALADDYSVGYEKKKLEKEKKKTEMDAAAILRIKDAADSMQKQVNAESVKHAAELSQRAATKDLYDSMLDMDRTTLVEEYLETLAPVLARSARSMFNGGNWVTGDRDAKLFLSWMAKRL